MKLFALFLVSSQAQRKTCFTCEAGSLSECRIKGKEKMCWKNQDSCFVQERLRNGRVEKVKKILPFSKIIDISKSFKILEYKFPDQNISQLSQSKCLDLQDSQSQD